MWMCTFVFFLISNTYLQSRKTWSWFPEIPTAILCHLLSAKTRGIFSTTFTAKLDEDEAVKDDDDEMGKNEECKVDEGSIISSESWWKSPFIFVDDDDELDDEVCSCENNLVR